MDDNLERELEQLKTSQGLLGQTSQQMGEQVFFVLMVLSIMVMMVMTSQQMGEQVSIVLMVLAMVINIFLSILVMMAMTSQQMRTDRRHPGIIYPNDDDVQHSSFTLRARCGR